VPPRLFGFGDGAVEARAVLTDPETGSEVARARDLLLEMVDTGEGFADPLDEYADVLSLWVCSLVPSQTVIIAKPYDLRLIVTDGGETLTTALSIQPACSDVIDGCECACLGELCSERTRERSSPEQRGPGRRCSRSCRSSSRRGISTSRIARAKLRRTARGNGGSVRDIGDDRRRRGELSGRGSACLVSFFIRSLCR
jgi:hypothetical protein